MSMAGFAIVPQPHGSEGFVKLSRTPQGKIYEKHILNYGPLFYPGVRGGAVDINDAWADRLIANFKAQVCDIVQVPLAGANNEHSEDPSRNIGEVVGLVKRNKKIYAQIDARDEVAASRLGKTLLGASALLHLNYTDTRTNQKVGPTLLHVAVTNRPYVVGLEDYKEVIAASAIGANAVDGMREAVVLSAPNSQEDKMELDDLKAELKADYGIDVDALVLSAGVVDNAVALSNSVQEALTEQGFLALSNDGEPSTEDLVGAINKAGEQIVSLTAEVEAVRTEKAKTDAESHVDSLVRSGHILPKNRDAQVTLLLSNAELFDQLLPEQPLVRLSNEGGEIGTHPADEKPAGDVAAEVNRLAELAKNA